jgi:ribosomal protein L40E
MKELPPLWQNSGDDKMKHKWIKKTSLVDDDVIEYYVCAVCGARSSSKNEEECKAVEVKCANTRGNT